MKNFKLENITLEVSTAEALTIRRALQWYKETRLPNENLWNPITDVAACKRCFGTSPSEANKRWRKEEAERLDEMCKVLWDAYMGYPFR